MIDRGLTEGVGEAGDAAGLTGSCATRGTPANSKGASSNQCRNLHFHPAHFIEFVRSTNSWIHSPGARKFVEQDYTHPAPAAQSEIFILPIHFSNEDAPTWKRDAC